MGKAVSSGLATSFASLDSYLTSTTLATTFAVTACSMKHGVFHGRLQSVEQSASTVDRSYIRAAVCDLYGTTNGTSRQVYPTKRKRSSLRLNLHRELTAAFRQVM